VFRIAVCLSGHMRSFAKTSETLFSCVARPGIYDDLHVEYYVHTWKSLDPEPGSPDICVASVMETYRPVFLCVEEHNPESWRARSMFRKIQLAYDAVVSMNREYDMVVRARPDTFFVSDVPLQSMTGENMLHLPNRADFGGYCDQFAVGDMKSMGIYSRMLSTLPRDEHFHPESRLKKYLCETDVVVSTHGSIRFKIMRSNGSLYDTMDLR